MRVTLNNINKSAILSLLLFLFLEVLSSSIFVSLSGLSLDFSVLFCLYFCLKFEVEIAPYLILLIQWLHSLFSSLSWSLETMIGLFFIFIIKVFKETLQLEGGRNRILITFVFYILWYLVRYIIYFFKFSNLEYLKSQVSHDLLSCFIITIFSIVIFKLLDRIWGKNV